MELVRAKKARIFSFFYGLSAPLLSIKTLFGNYFLYVTCGSVRLILLPWEPCTKILAWWTAKQCRRSRDESTSISSMCHFPSSNYLFRILKKIHVNGRNTSTLMFPFPSWVPFLPRAQVGQSSLNEIKSSIQRRKEMEQEHGVIVKVLQENRRLARQWFLANYSNFVSNNISDILSRDLRENIPSQNTTS